MCFLSKSDEMTIFESHGDVVVVTAAAVAVLDRKRRLLTGDIHTWA